MSFNDNNEWVDEDIDPTDLQSSDIEQYDHNDDYDIDRDLELEDE